MRTRFNRLILPGLPAAASLLFLAGTSLAQDFTTSTGGTWGDSTIWTPNGVPNGVNNTAGLVTPGPLTVDLVGNTYTVNQLNVTGFGTAVVQNGTLVFAGALPTFTNQITSNGMTATLNLGLQLNADTAFTTQTAGVITSLGGAISGIGNVIINGPGTFQVNTAQTYTTQTLINAAVFQAGLPGAFSQNSAVTLSGNGVLDLNTFNQSIGSLAGTSGTVLLGLGTAVLTTGLDSTNTTYGGTILGNGVVDKEGTGIWTLTGNATIGGTITINGGTLAISGPAALITVGNVVNNATFNLVTTTTTGIGTITNNGGSALNFSAANAANTVITNNNGSTTQFSDGSSAGSANLTNNNGGSTVFHDTSAAGNAAITNVEGGTTSFLDFSTAQRAIINNNGQLNFSNISTAGNASITNAASVSFLDQSSAGAAIINNNKPGIGLAFIQFSNTSTAGNAVITNNNGQTSFQDSADCRERQYHDQRRRRHGI